MRQTLAWILAIIGAVGAAVAYYGVWVLATTFAAGLVWYAALAVLGSGPIAAAGAALAFPRPRFRTPLVIGTTAFLAWAILATMVFTVLTRN